MNTNLKLKNLIEDNLEISLSKFCKEIKINRTTLYNILNDTHAPYPQTIKKICKYFNVDHKDYL